MIRGQSIIEPLEIAEGIAEVVIGLRIVWLDEDGILIAVNGLVGTSQFGLGHAEVVPGLGVIGPELQDTLVAADSFCHHPLFVECNAEFVVNFRIVGLPLKCITKALYTLIRLPDGTKGQTEIIVKECRGRIAGQRLLEMADCQVEPAPALFDLSEQVPGFPLGRVRCQDAAADLLGVIERTRGVILVGQCQGFGDGGHSCVLVN